MAEAIRIKLGGSVGSVLYSDLAAHLGRDAVFVVAPDLSLVDCGVAVATDDLATVEAFVRRGALRKPSAAERTEWSRESERRWNAIVVQPFVLIQDLP
jgi:hypothetical protein